MYGCILHVIIAWDRFGRWSDHVFSVEQYEDNVMFRIEIIYLGKSIILKWLIPRHAWWSIARYSYRPVGRLLALQRGHGIESSGTPWAIQKSFLVFFGGADFVRVFVVLAWVHVETTVNFPLKWWYTGTLFYCLQINRDLRKSNHSHAVDAQVKTYLLPFDDFRKLP